MTNLKIFLIVISFFFLVQSSRAQEETKLPSENDFYKIITVPTPSNIYLEVGGVTTLPDGRVAVSTRRGDIWIIENPYGDGVPTFALFATGLHESLGLAYNSGAFYAVQRGELTKLVDTNSDGKADVYETVYAWPLSGEFHEFSFGPKIAPDGSLFITTNVAFGDEAWWRGESLVPWRGWTLKIHPDGAMEPWACGMRSPCGLGMINGEFFYTDNQGDWFGACGIWHVTKGSFTGHPASLRWTGLPNSPIKLRLEQFYEKLDPRFEKLEGLFVKPVNIKDEKDPHFMFQLKSDFPELKMPAIWLPYAILGNSNSELTVDETNGKFGPFAGQIFIGDQAQSKIIRAVLEKVNGEFQGVAFDFRSGFQSGVVRMNWGHDGSMFIGETNRGWGSAGTTSSGLQRLIWTGKIPMEMKTVTAMPDGFEIEFTYPVDKNLAEDLSSYNGRSFTYKYHPVYGSPTMNEKKLAINGVKVSADGLKVRIVVDSLRQYYIYQIDVAGIRSKDEQFPVLHSVAYYTLNNIPESVKLSANEITKGPSLTKITPVKKLPIKTLPNQAPTYLEAAPLLTKNTCFACHNVSKRQVGPAFIDISSRKYSDEKIVDLIYNPKPEDWPEHTIPMTPMPQVPKKEALKIAAWINSLRTGKPGSLPH